MKDFLKWGLIGGGIAAFFFRQQIEAALGITAAAPPGPVPQIGPTWAPGYTPGAAAASSAPAPAPPPVATDAAGTKARMLAAAIAEGQYTANGGRLNADQWNYFYSTAGRGVPAPAPEDLGIPDHAMLLTIDEYWAAATAHGLSGIPRRRSRAARAWEM